MTMAPSTVSSDLSNLKIALDSSRMLDLLRSRFQEFREDFDLIEINVANVSYQSATRCTILYHLKVRKRG
ncbi:MAG TPA: hypothetical protein VD913_03035, partial [bacterium]|nr:hypothetical protein [bacterium]